MSTEFTAVMCGPDRPLGEILSAIEEGLVDRAGLQHAGKVLRCDWQPDSNTFDEASPEQALGPSEHLSTHADAMAGWTGFATELWNEKMLLYVLVARVARLEGAYVDAWVTLPTSQLERLASQGELPTLYAALAEIAGAMASTAGYGRFELAFEPLPPERAEQAIRSRHHCEEDRISELHAPRVHTLLCSTPCGITARRTDTHQDGPGACQGVLDALRHHCEEDGSRRTRAPRRRRCQGAISLPAVRRYVDMLTHGKVAPGIAVDGNVLVNGHHRYAAGRVAGIEPAVTAGMDVAAGRPMRNVRDLFLDPVDWGNR